MKLKDIPGYITARHSAARRADRLQDYWRDFAFLGLDEEIKPASASIPIAIPADADKDTREQLTRLRDAERASRTIKLRPLTLQMFIELCAVRSPFLTGGAVRPEHVAQVLWRLSAAYEQRRANPDARRQYMESIHELDFLGSVRALSRFLDRMLIDKPATSAKSAGRADTSFAASVVHAFGSAYGWSDKAILNLPMPALFQYLRKMQSDSDPEATVFNALRDRFTQRVFKFYKAKLKALTA